MWSQAVIVEVYPFSVLSMMGVLCFILRWIYAPNERRWLYFAMMLFGVCITNHMSLLVAAIGIEIAITAVQPKLGRDIFLGNAFIYVVILLLKANNTITAFDNNGPLFTFFHVVGVGSMITCGWLIIKTERLLTEWKPMLIMLLMWLVGAGFYFYMPIASMTNPPMNWGYPRMADGFLHAIKRGQYDSIHPTTSIVRYAQQAYHLYGSGVLEQFNLICVAIALVPFAFYRKMQRRERAWIIGLAAIFLCLSGILLFLLNPGWDRQNKQLHKVFFEASHVIIAMFIGYGLTLVAAFLATQYETRRRWVLYGAGTAWLLGLYHLVDEVCDPDRGLVGEGESFFRGLGKVLIHGHNQTEVYPAIFLLLLTVAFLVVILVQRVRLRFWTVLALFSLLPVWSIVGHWYENEQRGHLFGYWFGHDMFTPPFVAPDGRLSYDPKLRAEAMKGPNGRLVYPEMTRDAILFGGTDPGRFCPTYMIFCESFIPARSKPRDPLFDRRDVYIITQNALADNTYLNYIRAHYNRSTQKDTPFFEYLLPTVFPSVFREPIRAFAWLDDIFTSIGAKVEARRRAEGVYPRTEIKTPLPEDSQRAFNEYLMDANARSQRNQLRPGEEFRNDGGKIQVSGQVAVMSINGLLTKVIFDNNPTNEFFVEESFPLEWMFPYLSPYGVIMKINRQPQAEISQEMVDRDHAFWTNFSTRLIGNWITYDTPVTNVCAFAEKLYLNRDFKGFTGDPKFIRDDDAQKAFSKLRSSIGGIYAWRLGVLSGVDCPAQYRPRTPDEHARMVKEADFAFKQAFAFCPYSPEAIYRYMQLLLSVGRIDDAIAVVGTCKKLDPANQSIAGLHQQLQDMKKAPPPAQVTNSDFQNMFRDAASLIQQKKTNEAMHLLDQIVADPRADANTILNAARAFIQFNDGNRLEQALTKVVQLNPGSPEGWYDLAAVQGSLGREQALKTLVRALELNAQRLKADPKAKDLWPEAIKDDRFKAVREKPEYKQLRPPK